MSKHACHIIKWRLISKKILKTLYVHSNTVHCFCVQLYSWFVCIYFNSPLLSGLLRWVELSNVVFRLLRCQRAAGGFRECQHSDPSWSPLPPPQQSARHGSSEPWGFSGEALLNHELVYVQKSTSTWMKDLISYAFLKVWRCCFVVVPRASVDRRRTEAAEPRGGFSAQQPSSHQGKNTSKPASTPHQWTFYPFMYVPKSTERAREPSHFLLHPPTVLPGCGQSHNLLCTPSRVWL